MANTLSDHLLNTLEGLLPYDFEKFKFKLQNTSLEKDHFRIPRGHLQMARPIKLATLLLTYYGEEYAVRLTLQILRAMNQRQLAEELHKATGPEHSAEEIGTDSYVGSSEENKAKSMNVPGVLESDGQKQSGDQSATLPASQPEVVKRPQKKSPVKRSDQKGPEGLDSQTKPWARSTAPLYRRSPVPSQSPGDKESRASAQLRRNASSAGRLQGLYYNGIPGRRECKKSEVYLPSGKKRPKSLEITISSGGGPPNPEMFLTQKETRNGNPPSAATPRGLPTLDIGTTVSLEKDLGNPEHFIVLEVETCRTTLPKALLAGEKKCTIFWKENGIGGPGTLELSQKMSSSALSESPNPEVPLSVCEKQEQTLEDSASLGSVACKGRSQDEAACPLCHTQEGDLQGGSFVQNSCSCSIAPGDPKASGRCSSICSQCQMSPARKSSGDLNSQLLPQCPRHMNQVQLLFCEDHKESICLICRLSQEHRGHRVCPIEEAALEYKEQIQKQLEHLKELKKCGEEHRLQGEKTTESFLKQTETQKQRVQCQLEKLYQFLEQQEQLFVDWLQELGQTIGQVQKTYDTQVSQDIALLDELIGELEAKQGQPEWKLMQDIGVTLHRAKTVTVPEPLTTPPDVKEKIHLLYQKSEFVEKSMQYFLETLHSKMETFNAVDVSQWGGHRPSIPEVLSPIPSNHLKWTCGDTRVNNVVLESGPQAHPQPQPAQDPPELYETPSQNNKRKARSFLKWKPPFVGEPWENVLPTDSPQLGILLSAVDVILQPATTHLNLIFSDDMKSVRLGNKLDSLPDNHQRLKITSTP
ncbi:pyrin isoform X2 [Nannospalax galili]|nr:pyrin isoform X2 [Nannospalax galili]XP_029425906.1 pyrin isoform X2 [Nannospalax galili]XP_029425911.1 pyrin isoform X2 [Nannospalax galili]XP_029425916.1 pyrin isoform X2 [Nannospalax galili]